MNFQQHLQNWLIQPTNRLIDPENRRQARFLATLLLFMLSISIGYTILVWLYARPDPDTEHLLGGIISAGILLITYVISRTKWYETAVFLFAFCFSFIIIHTIQTESASEPIVIFFVVPVVISSMVLSFRKTVGVILIETVSIVYLWFSYDAPTGFWEASFSLVVMFGGVSGLILLAIQHRNQIEKIREETFRQQENRYQIYFENASDWLFTVDNAGTVTSINKVACKELGYPANAIVGVPAIDFVVSESTAYVTQLLHQVLAGKDVPYAETAVTTRTGHIIWIEIKGRTLYQQGKISGVFFIARNITNKKLAETTRIKLNREIKLFYEVGRKLGKKMDLNQVYKTIYECVHTYAPCTTFAVSTYDPTTGRLRTDYVRHFGCEKNLAIMETLPLKSYDDIHQQVILTGESALISEYPPLETHHWFCQIHNLAAKDGCVPHPNQIPAIHSAIIIPLKTNDDVFGLIQVYNANSQPYTPEHLLFLEAVSPHVVAAITIANLLKQSQHELLERKRAEAAARKRQALAETLQNAIAILNSSLGLEDVLSKILEQLYHAIPYDSASIQQKEGEKLVLKAAHGFDNDQELLDLSFAIDANLPNAEVVRTGQPLAVTDVTATYAYFRDLASEFQASKIRSWLGVPLQAPTGISGMITLDRNEVNPFTKDEITLAVTFANHAAMALYNAALYRTLETHSEALEQAVVRRTSELQRTTEQVQAILNNSPDAILLLNEDQIVEKCNPATHALLGYADHEIIGQSPGWMILAEDQPKFEEAVTTAVSRQNTTRLELTLKGQNGRCLEVTAALAPIMEEDHLSGIVCSLHDISGFKEVERLKDAFVSNVSHELRTPITNLRLHHDLLLLNPQKRDVYLDRQGREIDRLNNIIEDLLSISRLDQKRIEIHATEFSLIDIAVQYLNDRKTQAQHEHLQLAICPAPAQPQVTGDRRLIEQVLSILITNAMNYTPAGGEIHIKPCCRNSGDQTWIGLCIRDTGPGIAGPEQDRIFDRFYRGQVGLESGKAGTGLGLAIAREILALHDGILELEDPQPDEGASFCFWLPKSTNKNTEAA